MNSSTQLTLEDGSVVTASCPLIISASRSTDIPAFYADWFFRRLEAGYSVWKNPFSGSRTYISYEKVRFIVFWTKNPAPVLPYLDILDRMGIGYYFQYTLNDYEKEGLEPGVPPLESRLETFMKLSDRLGPDAVIWRFDPLLLIRGMAEDELLSRITNIGERLRGYTEKLVFSFADISSYRSVAANMKSARIQYEEWTAETMARFASRLSSANRETGLNLSLESCGEMCDLERYGIHHGSCVDWRLIASLSYRDSVLMDSIGVSYLDPLLPGCTPEIHAADSVRLPDGRYATIKYRKDGGQRKCCGCYPSKDIGEYGTCPHLCVYCYANHDRESVMRRWRRHKENPNAETLTGA